jgi:hypothetical protein
MKRNQPLTLDEVRELSDEWFPLFNEVHGRLPDGASVEETLKVMEKISALAGAKIAEQEKQGKDYFFCKAGA